MISYSDAFDGTALSDKWVVESTYFGPDYTAGGIEATGGRLHVYVNPLDPGMDPDDQRRASAVFRHPVGVVDMTISLSALIGDPSGNARFAFIGIESAGFTPRREFIGVEWTDGVLSLAGLRHDGDTIAATYSAAFTDFPVIRFRRDRTRVRIWIDGDLVRDTNDFTELPARIGAVVVCTGEDGMGALFDDFSVEWESPMAEYLWYILPEPLKAYPLAIAANGDLALTPNGVTCLLQDAANIFESPRGGFKDHPFIGAGVRSFLGESEADGPRSRLAAQLAASMRRRGLYPRVAPERSSVTVRDFGDGAFRVEASIETMDGDTVVPLNFVYRYGIEGFSEIYANPPSAVTTTTPVGPDGYTSPALGRDLLMDRGNPATSSEDIDGFPQRKAIEAVGMAYDDVRDAMARMRQGLFRKTATGTDLDEQGAEIDLKRKAVESDADYSVRQVDEFEQKHRDGTIDGLLDLLEFYGFDATATEGVFVVGPDDVPDAYWDRIFVDMTAFTDITVGEIELKRRVFKKSRADRRIVYRSIGGDVGRWDDGGSWDDGGIWDSHDVFA